MGVDKKTTFWPPLLNPLPPRAGEMFGRICLVNYGLLGNIQKFEAVPYLFSQNLLFITCVRCKARRLDSNDRTGFVVIGSVAADPDGSDDLAGG